MTGSNPRIQLGKSIPAPNGCSKGPGQLPWQLTQIPRTPAFSVRSAHSHGSVPVRLWFGGVRGTHGVPARQFGQARYRCTLRTVFATSIGIRTATVLTATEIAVSQPIHFLQLTFRLDRQRAG